MKNFKQIVGTFHECFPLNFPEFLEESIQYKNPLIILYSKRMFVVVHQEKINLF